MLFDMIGTQAISLASGRVIPPCSGAFEANEEEMPAHLLAWFEQIGAVRKAQVPVALPAPDQPAEPPARRRRHIIQSDDEKEE